MSGFARDNKGLKDTFPQSGRQLHEPSELSEFVQLVHPIFGPLVRLGEGERVFVTATEANGQTQAIMAVAPAGVVRVVEYGHAFHNMAAGGMIRYRIQQANGGTLVHIQGSAFEGPGTNPSSQLHFPLKRPVFLGPGEELHVFISVGGAEAITWACCFTDYTAADLPSPVR